MSKCYIITRGISMADCNHDCASCSIGDCAERTIQKLEPNKNTVIKHCFAVISGKGGVGKSLVTSLLASMMNKKGYNVAVLDADITGPSIPQAFGLKVEWLNQMKTLFILSYQNTELKLCRPTY